LIELTDVPFIDEEGGETARVMARKLHGQAQANCRFFGLINVYQQFVD